MAWATMPARGMSARVAATSVTGSLRSPSWVYVARAPESRATFFLVKESTVPSGVRRLTMDSGRQHPPLVIAMAGRTRQTRMGPRTRAHFQLLPFSNEAGLSPRAPVSFGAGEGSRTLVTSLGSSGNAVIRRPQSGAFYGVSRRPDNGPQPERVTAPLRPAQRDGGVPLSTSRASTAPRAPSLLRSVPGSSCAPASRYLHGCRPHRARWGRSLPRG